MDAVLKPEVTGPTKAMGTIKQPDTDTAIAIIKNNLFNIESPPNLEKFICVLTRIKEIINSKLIYNSTSGRKLFF